MESYAKKITLQTYGKDKYGCSIADVILLDGRNLNQELVKPGWWWYRKYAPGNTVLEELEKGSKGSAKELVGRSAASAAVRIAETCSFLQVLIQC